MHFTLTYLTALTPLHHQPRMPHAAALLGPDVRGNVLFQTFHMADAADHLAAGVQRCRARSALAMKHNRNWHMCAKRALMRIS